MNILLFIAALAALIATAGFTYAQFTRRSEAPWVLGSSVLMILGVLAAVAAAMHNQAN